MDGGGGGGACPETPGRVEATGAGGGGAGGAADGDTVCLGGAGGAEPTPNLLRPFEEKFAAAAATLPKPGEGLSSDPASAELVDG